MSIILTIGGSRQKKRPALPDPGKAPSQSKQNELIQLIRYGECPIGRSGKLFDALDRAQDLGDPHAESVLHHHDLAPGAG